MYKKVIWNTGFFYWMQKEWRDFGPKYSKKTTSCKDQVLLKIFNEKRWSQQKDMFDNLRNFENVKNKLKKLKFHYVASYFYCEQF